MSIVVKQFFQKFGIVLAIVFFGIVFLTFGIGHVILAIFCGIGNGWVSMQLFIMHANGDTNYSVAGFISDSWILSCPAEQSFLELLIVFTRKCLFRGYKNDFLKVIA